MTTSTTAPVAPSPAPVAVALEQYRLYVADLGNIGLRYTSLNAFYMTLVTALLSLLSLKERRFADVDPTLVALVCSFGLLLCLLWFNTITYFSALFRIKFAVLADLERGLAFPCFARERETLRKVQRHRWTRLERYIPVILAALFAAIAGVRLSS